MKVLKNWDNKTWLSSNPYISSFNSFLLKKKKLNKSSRILDIGCGRGKIFGSLSRKLKLTNKPIGIDPVFHNDVDKSIDFINEDVFEHTATKSYDIVIPDIWWNQTDITPSQKTAIGNIFSASAQIEYPLDT